VTVTLIVLRILTTPIWIAPLAIYFIRTRR
jgi:hypothetical protein